MKTLKTFSNWIPILAIAVLGFLALRQWQPAAMLNSRPQSEYYQVIRVSDGDTIAVRSLNTGQEARIRLACIDAPEVAHDGQPGQPIGEESKANLKRWIDQAKGEVIVQEVDRDRYGRIVGEVFIQHPKPSQPEEELLLNAEQVRDGMAYVYRKYAKSCSQVEIFDDLEKTAKASRKGVWAGNYQKPWDFRQSMK
ncbi:MAG: thermonuclease family protein [Leptolyngbyaceae cyanobacterium bins.302]|nr:thermonuclease family protein [Leptolyngbyaceae cyanobacterium bins.302]